MINHNYLLGTYWCPEVIKYCKKTGKGWQIRIDEALKEWINNIGIMLHNGMLYLKEIL